MNYSQISFFEEINFWSSERMHSEIIRWILSGNFPEINNTILSDFYKNFLKIENISEIIFCWNEIENIDIFIETQNEIIIMENKFKSSEHSNQLEKYENILREKYPNKQHFCFLLTLIDEKASSKNWTNITYKELLNALQKLPQKIQKHYIIENYILYLEKITKTLDSIIKNPQNYKSIFLNGNIKKVEKNENFLNNLPTEEEKFIAKNQLETIFQKAYLYSIISKIKEINKFHINEAHWTAMLQIPIAEEIIYQNEKFNIFLEAQNQTIKYCFMHENYFHSNHKIIEKIPKIFEEIFKNSPFTKINSPRKYAFVSASRKLTKPYYEMEAEEFQWFMKKEIDIVKKLTEKFLQKI